MCGFQVASMSCRNIPEYIRFLDCWSEKVDICHYFFYILWTKLVKKIKGRLINYEKTAQGG